MKEDLLKQLIEKTFAKIACPLQGNGVYSEIQKAVMAAYILGSNQPSFGDATFPVSVLEN